MLLNSFFKLKPSSYYCITTTTTKSLVYFNRKQLCLKNNNNYRLGSTCCHKKESPNEIKLSPISLEFWSHPDTWQRTRINTLRCLIGCTSGDFATMWYLQYYYPDTSPIYSTAAAMVAGISTSLALETVLLKKSMSIPYPVAFKTAMGMSFVSMLVMELSENLMDWHLMGGQVLFDDPKFWLAGIASTITGFIVPLPYNYWRLRALGKSCH
ncbi:uncharacterized protein BX663DRAFT_554817 [Cokeromyces recurvatus]|uniref:uncharacterized protein n=1 Tax=Cokeromyces recurvatus TaxID=90255 RepID=UPI00222013EA|nr:uncharacterized protein BX663DRAFT_554817 [Cokeromyces recurvatus]KAI7899641.1 hypothetical protein BX663DRAFT_554817 [Cokeromyces recurvatus]